MPTGPSRIKVMLLIVLLLLLATLAGLFFITRPAASSGIEPTTEFSAIKMAPPPSIDVASREWESKPSTSSFATQVAAWFSKHNSTPWCNGEETICTTATADKPAETLKRLIAAIPPGKAKHYKIRLSVTPVETVEAARQ